MWMTILGLVAKAGAGLLGYAQKRSDAAVEKYKVDGAVATASIQAQAAVIRTGMATGWFWIPWSIAAIPLSAWFGWGILDSLANGALPDVAELPPQLKEYADAVWRSIFLAGAGVAGVQTVTTTAGRIAANWIARR